MIWLEKSSRLPTQLIQSSSCHPAIPPPSQITVNGTACQSPPSSPRPARLTEGDTCADCRPPRRSLLLAPCQSAPTRSTTSSTGTSRRTVRKTLPPPSSRPDLTPLPGFTHSAFAFGNESLIAKSSVAFTDIPPGALITFLQKGLEYISIEEHINEVGQLRLAVRSHRFDDHRVGRQRTGLRHSLLASLAIHARPS